VEVHERWESLGRLSGSGSATQVSDENGFIRFPAPVPYGSVVGRILGSLLTHVAVHASNGTRFTVRFAFSLPRKAVFTLPAFKALEPFSTSHTYVDSANRYYHTEIDRDLQRVSVSGNFLSATNEIVILVDDRGPITR
jgi:hypothetical protein